MRDGRSGRVCVFVVVWFVSVLCMCVCLWSAACAVCGGFCLQRCCSCPVVRPIDRSVGRGAFECVCFARVGGRVPEEKRNNKRKEEKTERFGLFFPSFACCVLNYVCAYVYVCLCLRDHSNFCGGSMLRTLLLGGCPCFGRPSRCCCAE